MSEFTLSKQAQRKPNGRALDVAGRMIEVYRTYLSMVSPADLREADEEAQELLTERCGPIERALYREEVA